MKKITHPSFCFSALILVGALATTASAQNTTTTTSDNDAIMRKPADMSKNGDKMKHSDSNFIEKAAKSGMEEVAISQIAVTRASNPDVRAFAEMMVTDHGSANTNLSQLAGTKGVMLPMKELNEHKWTTKKEGKDFDEDYLERMIDAHQEAVKLYEKAGKSADHEVAAYAQNTLPTLLAHLNKAKELKKALR